MDFIHQDTFLPTLAFFLFFGVAFSMIELILVFLLDHLAESHWKWMIDVIIKSKVKHGKLIKRLSYLIILSLISTVIWLTPITNILQSRIELKVLAIGLPIIMVGMFYFNVYKTTKLKIEKQIYGSLFLMLSIILYGSLLSIANESYDLYASKINNSLIQPGSEQIKGFLQGQEKKKLLIEFKAQYLKGDCQAVDYKNEEKNNKVTHLIYVKNDPELATEKKTEELDPKKSLKGMECKNEENRFLLTPGGDWYWVKEEILQQNKK